MTATASAAPTSGGAASAPGGASDLNAKLSEFTVDPGQGAASAGQLTFHVQNAGSLPHDFIIIRSDADPAALPVVNAQVDLTKVQVVTQVNAIAPGEKQDLRANLPAGKYILICNVPAHYQAGMHAEFTTR